MAELYPRLKTPTSTAETLFINFMHTLKRWTPCRMSPTKSLRFKPDVTMHSLQSTKKDYLHSSVMAWAPVRALQQTQFLHVAEKGAPTFLLLLDVQNHLRRHTLVLNMLDLHQKLCHCETGIRALRPCCYYLKVLAESITCTKVLMKLTIIS